LLTYCSVFQQCKHLIITIDCQLSGPVTGMLVFVSANLQLVGEQHTLKFSHVFLFNLFLRCAWIHLWFLQILFTIWLKLNFVGRILIFFLKLLNLLCFIYFFIFNYLFFLLDLGFICVHLLEISSYILWGVRRAWCFWITGFYTQKKKRIE